MPTSKNFIFRAWERFVDHFNQSLAAESERIERAIGFARLYEQLWYALDESEQAANGWPYPLDIYVGDDGTSLFSIVAQNGKLYQVPLTVSQDNLSLGAWTQVTEAYKPVEQTRFSVTRQKNGTHRWTCIAATTVLNRVGEIDSSELFDNFIKRAEETGNYPRLDFYHLGSADPKTWEFGTADYLARDGFCYIASGTFDEDHPLAKATIRAYEDDPGVWGNSIEFYSWAEPELILLDPEIRVPMYRDGENTRISVVKEKDAASLFTRIGVVSRENTRIMDSKIEEKLKDLFGDDEEGLKAFISNADSVNRTIADENLIRRAKKDDPKPEDPDEDEDEDEDTEGDEETDEVVAQSLVLDDEGLAAIVEQLAASSFFAAIQQSLTQITQSVEKLASGQEESKKEITRLKKAGGQMIQQIEALSADDSSKKQTYLEDMPRRKTVTVTYRKRDADPVDEDEDGEEDSNVIAQSTLSKLPSY